MGLRVLQPSVQMLIRRTRTPRTSLLSLSTITKSFSSKPKQTTSTTMPSYIVTCKDHATEEEIAAAKQEAKDQGGTIGHEYTLIKGFQVTFPEGTVQTLEHHEHISSVEEDQDVHTQ
ncbi:hypothetical protein B0T21DRAFT_360791 [Apiosordaria backusii]|uniref:Inhibitor I9 domain-containing protein n=1 Tax=Apiosordaria backusii TaxID=314023 RepID=A0AA40EMS6_9PEZI|nr:hypothetical protein B0T21DRAFT_360791 [Apiosordaria backusii]